MMDEIKASYPRIIQGGMGVAVSDWRLARAVSMQGQLGVVSGTGLDIVLARRLQLGDLDGAMRQAMAEFPFAEMSERILGQYFIAGGKSVDAPFKSNPLLGIEPTQAQLELLVVANFVEVYLAREGHQGLVGLNLLEKIQLPTLPSLFGAMLAGVDFVLMGAGIPRHIPEVLDQFAAGQAADLPLTIEGAGNNDRYVTRFDPEKFTGGRVPWLKRPKFLAIVASATLATMLARKSSGRVDGFVLEGPTAGGHNASPRGPLQTNSRGEPVYGERDEVDLEIIRKLGLPFWLAGSYGSPEKIRSAMAKGAAGVQIGTAFAFCNESGLSASIKRTAMDQSRAGTTDVFTDPLASPTGFPFKVLRLAGSLSESETYLRRERICDLGYLRQGYKKADESIGWRCPGEQVDAFIAKGGSLDDSVGRKCLCNGLMSNVGLAQVRKKTGAEPVIVTCGEDVSRISQFLPTLNALSYSAKDVIDFLLKAAEAQPAITYTNTDACHA
jgi:nitronate monooxygenase